MKFKKCILAAIVSAAVTVNFSTCFQNADALQCDIIQTEKYDIDWMKEAADKLSEACSKTDNDEEVTECFWNLINEYDRYETDTAVSKLNYFEDEYFLQDYQYEKQLSADIKKTMYKCLSEQLSGSEYTELITGLLGEDFAEYVKVSAAISDDGFLDKVADNENDLDEIISDDGDSDDGVPQNIKIAQNYIDKMKMYKEKCEELGITPMDYFYQQYSRDYNNEEIKEISEAVKDILSVISPVNDYYFGACIEKAGYNDIIDYFVEIPLVDPMDVTAEYAGRISEDLGESADLLIYNHLYTITSKYVSRLNEGFTTVLPSENVPYIYIGCIKRLATNLGMCVHEFGHFNALHHSDCRNSFLKPVTNIDIAETQSQALTLLYLNNFFDEIYGEEASRFIKQYELKNVIFKLSVGFFINEFENYVCSHADEITPEELIDKYNSLMKEYDINPSYLPFASNTVMLSSPGYCISYSMSLLASLDILKTDTEDHEKAVDMYNRISRTNIYESSFKDTLKNCGFDDVLSKDYISGMKEFFNEYLDDVQGTISGDIDDDKNVSSNDYLLLKSYLLDDEDVDIYDSSYYFDVVADLNRDGKINVFDAMRLKIKLLNQT